MIPLVATFLIRVQRPLGRPVTEAKYAASPTTWGVAMEVPEMMF